jgi:hypothetical protein
MMYRIVFWDVRGSTSQKTILNLSRMFMSQNMRQTLSVARVTDGLFATSHGICVREKQECGGVVKKESPLPSAVV